MLTEEADAFQVMLLDRHAPMLFTLLLGDLLR